MLKNKGRSADEPDGRHTQKEMLRVISATEMCFLNIMLLKEPKKEAEMSERYEWKTNVEEENFRPKIKPQTIGGEAPDLIVQADLLWSRVMMTAVSENTRDDGQREKKRCWY